MPGQGPPFFYPDYFQNQQMPVMDDRFHHPHPQGPAIPGPQLPIMAPPYGNQYSFRPPLWGPPAFNYNHNNNIHHNNNLRNLQPVPRSHAHPRPQPSEEGDREKVCFICQDPLQNSEERGIHLCDGGHQEKEETKEKAVSENFNVDLEDMDARLGIQVLKNINGLDLNFEYYSFLNKLIN